MIKVITYGTFDLLHPGHIKFLQNAKSLGDHLTVAVSTCNFNEVKGKKSYYCCTTRSRMLKAIRYVDKVIFERSWKQKVYDIKKFDIDIVVMGDDWKGHPEFEKLKDVCRVVYLPRTPGISSTHIKRTLSIYKEDAIK